MAKSWILIVLFMSSFLCGHGAVVNARNYEDDYGDYGTPTTNTNNNVLCDDGTLVTGGLCDGTVDCADSSDEATCDDYSYQVCNEGEIACDSGTCVNGTVCDDILDCTDGSDEVGCGAQGCNGDGQFLCTDGTCVNGTACDAINDCADGSDELDCDYYGGACTSEQYTCVTDQSCIPLSKKCDGNDDCTGGDDEVVGCTTTSPPTTTNGQLCESDQFECDDGTCIQYEMACDGTDDCLGGEDEMDCGCNATTEFSCDDGTCLDISQRCDGIHDCLGEEDEVGCATTDSTLITTAVPTTTQTVDETTTAKTAIEVTTTAVVTATTMTFKEITKAGNVTITSAPVVILCQYDDYNFTAGTTIEENLCNKTYCADNGTIMIQKLPNADPEKCSSIAHTINVALLVLAAFLSTIL